MKRCQRWWLRSGFHRCCAEQTNLNTERTEFTGKDQKTARWLGVTALDWNGLVSHISPLPRFFISVASKGLSVYVSGLESTLTGISISVDSKGAYIAPNLQKIRAFLPIAIRERARLKLQRSERPSIKKRQTGRRTWRDSALLPVRYSTQRAMGSQVFFEAMCVGLSRTCIPSLPN